MSAHPALAQRTEKLDLEAIKEIFAAVARDDVLSLAGGIPDASLFPLDQWGELLQKAHDRHAETLYQYSNTAGLVELREEVARQYNQTHDAAVGADDIVITSGAQSAMDIASALFLDPGDGVVVEAPTFLGALSTFHKYQADILPVQLQNGTLDLDELDETLADERSTLLYLIPTFQNPSGNTLSEDERDTIAELLEKHDVFLLEDDPYRVLRYSGTPRRSIHARVPERVIYASSFSKMSAPGARLGYVVVPDSVRGKFMALKQATDLHSSNISQAFVLEYLQDERSSEFVEKAREVYGKKLDVLDVALRETLGDQFTWQRPDGGMFLWLTGPEAFDSLEVYYEAVENGVAYVPGQYFYPDGFEGAKRTMRLNFTTSTEDELRTAVARLSEVFRFYFGNTQQSGGSTQ